MRQLSYSVPILETSLNTAVAREDAARETLELDFAGAAAERAVVALRTGAVTERVAVRAAVVRTGAVTERVAVRAAVVRTGAATVRAAVRAVVELSRTVVAVPEPRGFGACAANAPQRDKKNGKMNNNFFIQAYYSIFCLFNTTVNRVTNPGAQASGN